MRCPRRNESALGLSMDRAGVEDEFRSDRTCSYCGSVDPDYLMERLEAGTAELTPTDKSYKVYVNNNGGEPFLQTYRDCPQDAKCTGPDDCTHWVTRQTSMAKFYFQHLSEPQMIRFIELLNEKKLKLGYPGYFYAPPYFITYK